MVGGLRQGVAEQAEAMVRLLGHTRPGVLDSLRLDALTELSSSPDLVVRITPEDPSPAAGTGRCSVAGHYGSYTEPPTLNVARSMSVRRRQFTVLHELGHHLQQTDEDLGQAALDQPDSEEFEDAACDVFASRILLPDELVAAHIPFRGPTADGIAGLFAASSASRAACCVRAAQQLRSAGCVVLLDESGTVSFASGSGIYPPARGSDQSATPLIDAALRSQGRDVERDRTRVAYRNGGTSDSLYGQAAWCDGFIVAVLAVDHVPWRKFAPPRPDTARSTTLSRWHDCEICLTNFRVTDTCPTCHTPLCPDGHCTCSAAREQLCTSCFQMRHRTQFIAGSTLCKECRE